MGLDLPPSRHVGVSGVGYVFANMSLSELSREIEVWVEAMDMRRPSREKDIADLNSLAPFYLPIVQVYSQMTGDEKPLNAFLHRFATAMQMRNPKTFTSARGSSDQISHSATAGADAAA